MKVLGLASYPIEAAATRYRLIQFIEPLAKRGIELTARPFLNSKAFANLYNRSALPSTVLSLSGSTIRRMIEISDIRSFDVLFVQREAMLFGPPFIEWLITKWGNRPLVLDLDDATYIPYKSPTYGKLASSLKFFGKTDTLISWSDVVICGNPFIAKYVSSKGKRTEIIPTVVDTEIFSPTKKNDSKDLVVGWIGTHSTFPFLQKILPVLQDLARKHRYKLKIVGAGVDEIKLDEVQIDNLKWKLEREIEDFQSIDIGLYPLVEDSQSGFVAGKSGFKAIQYMSVGIPFVVSPIGVCAEMGVVNKTHFSAATLEDWYNALDKLMSDSKLREIMGNNGRQHALKHYTVENQVDKLSKLLSGVRLNR